MVVEVRDGTSKKRGTDERRIKGEPRIQKGIFSFCRYSIVNSPGEFTHE